MVDLLAEKDMNPSLQIASELYSPEARIKCYGVLDVTYVAILPKFFRLYLSNNATKCRKGIINVEMLSQEDKWHCRSNGDIRGLAYAQPCIV